MSHDRRACPGEPFPPPSWHLDYLDFPTAWHVLRLGVVHLGRRCSWIQTWGGLICDCGAVEAEWARRKAAGGFRDAQCGPGEGDPDCTCPTRLE